MGLGASVCAVGCSDGFHDVGDAEETSAGGSAGSSGSGGNAGNDGDTGNDGDAEFGGDAVTATASTGNGSGTGGNAAASGSVGGVTATNGEPSPGPVTSASTTGGIASPSCIDDRINGSESDVDCGGPYCLPCPEGSVCNAASDCEKQVCSDKVCSAATCDDRERNGDETDIDCGGACPPCVAGAGCVEPQDCASGRCGEDEACEEVRAELDDCGASPAAAVGFSTEAELEALLIGAWLLCPNYADDPSEREPPGVVGIEFTSDYRYSYLLEDTDGALMRGEGIDFTGDWYIGTEAESGTTSGGSTPLIIRPETADSRTYYRPTFTDGPVQLRFDEYFGLFHALRYVPVDLSY